MKRQRPGPTSTEIEVAAAVLAYNVALSRAIPRAAYVPANVAAAGLSIAAARGLGVSPADLGLRRDRVGRGLRVGLAAALPVVAAVALGATLPATRRYFADERARAGGAGHVLYEVLVRIPLGTALAEEAIFRGSVLGLLLQRHPGRTAAAMSSLLFGFWHVLPTLDTLQLDPAGAPAHGDPVRAGGAVAASVLATAAGGCALGWLRLRADSVVAPAVAHACLNSSAFLAARLVAGSLPDRRPARAANLILNG